MKISKKVLFFFALKSKKNEYIWEEVHTISNLYLNKFLRGILSFIPNSNSENHAKY